jgi:hypothetical protein
MPPLAPDLKASYNKIKHGWTAGHNLRLDFRFGLDDPDRLRKYATELVALAPDVRHLVLPAPAEWRHIGHAHFPKGEKRRTMTTVSSQPVASMSAAQGVALLLRSWATVQPLPDSMSAKFALQWRYNGCVACREVCDGVRSAIR